MPKTLTFLAILWISSRGFAGDPKFSVAAIPEDLKTGMYAVIREDHFTFYIDSKNRSSQHIRKVITILNSKAKQYAMIAIGYDKLRKIENLKANVYDAEGDLIKKLKQSDIVDRSNISGFSLFEDDRAKYADLAQSTYPYTVEIEYTIEMQFLFTIPNFHLYVDDEVSAQETSYSIVYPKALKPRYRLFKVSEPEVSIQPDQRESLTWKFKNIKPGKFEPFDPDFDELVPNIMSGPGDFEFAGYSGNMNSWEEYGKWQTLLNKDRDVLPEATRQKIKNLTKDLPSTEEKVKAVYEYLQNRTRYVSIQLGIGGWQPFEASVVDQTGYGDCKALSNYAVALLKEVGVKGYYTEISAGDNPRDIIADFPRVQFNHIIVAVPDEQDTIWLECTSQTNPFGYLGSFTGDRKALMITETGGKVVHTVRYSAEQNSQIRTADVFVDANGDATAKVRTTYSGLQYENGDLNFYIDNKYEDQKKWLRENTAIPSFDISKFTMVNKKDRIPAAIVSVDLSLRRFATVSGKRVFLTPNLMNRSTFIPEKVTDRKSNVMLKSSYTDIDTIRYHLQEGIYPEFLPEPIKIESRFGTYETTFTLDQDNLMYIRKITMRKGEFPPEAYRELIEFYRSMNKADNTKMVFLNKT